MRRVLVFVVCCGAVLLLAGCDFATFLDDLISQITGGGRPQYSAIVVNYGFEIQVNHKNVGVESRTLDVHYQSLAPVVYSEVVDSYVSQSPINDLPYIYINVSLNEAGTMITYLGCWRNMPYQNGTWQRVDQITAENIPLDREVGGSKFFRIDASNIGWSGLPYVDYKDWLVAQTNDTDPTFQILDTYAAQDYFDADPNRYIEIELRQ